MSDPHKKTPSQSLMDTLAVHYREVQGGNGVTFGGDGVTFALSWEDVWSQTPTLFYEKSPEAAREALFTARSQGYSPPDFEQACREVIDGKPLPPYHFGLSLDNIHGQYPNVDLKYLVFSGFEREVYLTHNMFLESVWRALADARDQGLLPAGKI